MAGFRPFRTDSPPFTRTVICGSIGSFLRPLRGERGVHLSAPGLGIQKVGEARRHFLDAVEEQSKTSCEREELLATVRALRGADDLTVTTETYATVGNIDLAVFSPKGNAILVVEHKTGSALSKWQLTKYRLAMRAADPTGARKLGTVLLRSASRTAAGEEKDRTADPSGVEASCRLTHEGHLKKVFAALGRELDGSGLGDRIVKAALRRVFPSSGSGPGPGSLGRRALLDELAGGIPLGEWTLLPRSASALSLKLVHPVTGRGHLHLTIGPNSHNMLWAQFRDTPVRLRPCGKEDEPRHVFDLWPGAASFSFPTPFPVHHADKPWIGERPEDRSLQVRVAMALLAALPSHVQ